SGAIREKTEPQTQRAEECSIVLQIDAVEHVLHQLTLVQVRRPALALCPQLGEPAECAQQKRARATCGIEHTQVCEIVALEREQRVRNESIDDCGRSEE